MKVGDKVRITKAGRTGTITARATMYDSGPAYPVRLDSDTRTLHCREDELELLTPEPTAAEVLAKVREMLERRKTYTREMYHVNSVTSRPYWDARNIENAHSLGAFNRLAAELLPEPEHSPMNRMSRAIGTDPALVKAVLSDLGLEIVEKEQS